MKLRCLVDPVEALRRGIDAPEGTVLELNPSLLSPAEREWLAGAVRKAESVSPDEPAPLVFPYPIPAPSVEGLREAIAAHITDITERVEGPAHGVTTRFDQALRQEARPAAPAAPPAVASANPVGEVAKAAGFLGLGAFMGGMLDRVFGPHAQAPTEVILEQEQPREGSWGEPGRQEAPAEPSSCCDNQEDGSDASASLADDDLDDSGGSDGGYDLV
ncbi:MAG: hypothetical protein PHO89_07025 [Methylacidiphilaceae bacterium]|nr:hypothetical protein [Candidatus Methylacidiphilaceae bacterium]